MALAETPLALNSNITAVFDANGDAVGEILVGPNQRWEVTLLNTNTTSTSQTRLTVYRGPVESTQVDFSRTGNGDTSNTDIKLQQGEKLSAKWTGGTPGAQATLNIQGTVFERGNRGYGV